MDLYDAKRRDWALERAQFGNAFLNGDGAGWTLEDFLGTGDRAKRVVEAQERAMRDKVQTMLDKRKAAAMDAELPKEDLSNVPQWALDAKAADDKRKAAAINGRQQ